MELSPQNNSQNSTVTKSNNALTPKALPLWKRLVVWLLRVSIGGVFILSGLVKMIDLWGFIFKIEDYLAVWQFSQPRTIVFITAMFISGYEFVLGTLLAMGCYKRVATWGIAAMMAVMLPLSTYLWYANPISDCGCFGDYWKLSNGETFIKNVLITAGVILLLLWNAKLKESLFNPAIQWIVGAWVSLYIIIIGLYGYNAQPVADFRSYPIGTVLASTTEFAEDENFVFIYEKDGEQKQFSINSLPDSTWTFIDRVAVNGDSEQNSGVDFAVFDADGVDVTADVIYSEGMELLLVVPEPRRAGVTFTYAVNEIYEYVDSLEIPFIALLGTNARGISFWRDNAMAEYPCYSADDTQLKELARGNVSLVILQDGVVTSKTTLSSMDPDVIESPSSHDAFMQELSGYGPKWFAMLNLVFGGALLFIYVFQGLILLVRAKIRRRIALKRQ